MVGNWIPHLEVGDVADDVEVMRQRPAGALLSGRRVDAGGSSDGGPSVAHMSPCENGVSSSAAEDDDELERSSGNAKRLTCPVRPVQ